MPAHCARLQLQETKKRWAMWCLAGNPDVEVYEGDFRAIPGVVKRLNEADVVVSTSLSRIFIQLAHTTARQQRGVPVFTQHRPDQHVPRPQGRSEDCQLEAIRAGGVQDERVERKLHDDFHLSLSETHQQCDSFAAIVKLESHHYAQGWVSWKGDSGRYYIQTIDRSARIKYEQRLTGGRSSRR